MTKTNKVKFASLVVVTLVKCEQSEARTVSGNIQSRYVGIGYYPRSGGRRGTFQKGIPIVIPDSDRESRNVVTLRLDRLDLPVTIFI